MLSGPAVILCPTNPSAGPPAPNIEAWDTEGGPTRVDISSCRVPRSRQNFFGGGVRARCKSHGECATFVHTRPTVNGRQVRKMN